MKQCSKSDAIWASFMGSFAIWGGGRFSKSDAIWASFMGSFAILGGLQPPIPTPMRKEHIIDVILLPIIVLSRL